MKIVSLFRCWTRVQVVKTGAQVVKTGVVDQMTIDHVPSRRLGHH